jgi:type IV secretion system protein VirB5
MPFLKKHKKTGNPYIDGHNEWQEMFGSYVNQAYIWRIVAFLSLIIALISAYGVVYQIKQHKVVPYIVEVDKLGKAAAVSRADLAIPVPRTLIQSELAQLIINWRTVTADLDLQRRMVERLSHFVTGAAQGYLTEWFSLNNPYEVAKANKLVQIEIKGLPLPVSQNSWRIEWTETIRNHNGTWINSTAYEATMSILITPPTTDQQIIFNPGGVWVTELSYSKILAAPNSADPATATPITENPGGPAQ